MSTQKNKTVSTRLDHELESFLINKFGTAGGGLAYVANAFKNIAEIAGTTDSRKIIKKISSLELIRAYTEEEINNIFTNEELFNLHILMKGARVAPEMRCVKAVYLATLKHQIKFEIISKDVDIDIEDIASKVQTLTAAQVEYLFKIID